MSYHNKNSAQKFAIILCGIIVSTAVIVILSRLPDNTKKTAQNDPRYEIAVEIDGKTEIFESMREPLNISSGPMVMIFPYDQPNVSIWVVPDRVTVKKLNK